MRWPWCGAAVAAAARLPALAPQRPGDPSAASRQLPIERPERGQSRGCIPDSRAQGVAPVVARPRLLAMEEAALRAKHAALPRAACASQNHARDTGRHPCQVDPGHLRRCAGTAHPSSCASSAGRAVPSANPKPAAIKLASRGAPQAGQGRARAFDGSCTRQPIWGCSCRSGGPGSSRCQDRRRSWRPICRCASRRAREPVWTPGGVWRTGSHGCSRNQPGSSCFTCCRRRRCV